MNADRKTWTVIEVLRWTTKYLTGKGFQSARLEVERLLASTLGADRVGLYLQFDRPLSPEELTEFKAKLKRRLRHEPLQYILGECEFLGLKLIVDRRALIPRPETETLVEVCTELLAKRHPDRFVDAGTGCGNIAIALAKAWPDARGLALEISQDAVNLARENAAQHGVEERLTFVVGDIFDDFLLVEYEHGFDLIASNPPYVPPAEWDRLPPEIRENEPKNALISKPDGLTFYRRLADVASGTLRSGGLLAVEIGVGQADAVRGLFAAANLHSIRIHKDLAGINRVVTACCESRLCW